MQCVLPSHTHFPDTGTEVHHGNTFNFHRHLLKPVHKCSERCATMILSVALLFSRHSRVNTGHMPAQLFEEQ